MNDRPDQDVNIYGTARQLPPERRGVYLDEACAGDAALRQRMDELLAAGDEGGQFLKTPGDELRATVDSHEKVGDRIGHYRLLQRIGEGGCGIVYMAEQEEPVRRFVALKVIKLGMDTRDVIARFEAERQALALMDHPNIAKVFDAGATVTGRPYFVMELVRGVKITDYCDEHQLSTSARLNLFVQICHAIQHAHQKGIIHRDIKPSNILVMVNDGAPLPKVIDFGIAKATHGKLSNQTVFTALEQFIGTPAYMSPEQARMGGEDIDTRSDIYSLGVLLYELLTGQTPFDARALLRAGLDEVRRVIREEEPVAPSTRLSTMSGEVLMVAAAHRAADVPKLIQSVRGDLDWIVMKALEKDRTRRYETATGFAVDIQRHLQQEPVLARPPSNLYRFQKLVQRHKLVFAAAAAIAAALAVGVALSVHALIVERRARLEAEKERHQAEINEQRAEVNEQRARVNEQKAQDEAAKSRQVAQFLKDMLNGVGPSVSLGRDTTMLKEIADHTAKRVQTDLANQPAVEAELCSTLGEVYTDLGYMESAEQMDRAALSVRLFMGTNDPEVAQSMRQLSHVLWREGHLAEAASLAREGSALQQRLFGDNNVEYARALEDYGAILNTEGRAGQASAILQKALDIKESVLGRDNLEVAEAMEDRAGFLRSQNLQVKEALRLYQDALSIRRKLEGPTNPLVIIAELKAKAAELDYETSSAAEAATLRELVAAQRKLFRADNPALAQSLNMLSSVLKNDGYLPESEACRREALSIQIKSLGRDSTEVAQTTAKLAEVLVEQNQLPEAEQLFRESFRVRWHDLGSKSTLAAESLTRLGEVLQKEGKWDDARRLYQDAAKDTSVAAAAAQYRLGLLCLRGIGEEKNPAAAAEWFRTSAGLNYAPGEIALAELYFNGIGVRQDKQQALDLFYKANKQGEGASLRTLADCYCASGQTEKSLNVLQRIWQSHPNDTDTAITLATWQAWFGRNDDYAATCHRLIAQAAGSDQAVTLMRAAKATCLQPLADPALLGSALSLAKRSVELRKGSPRLAWYELSLGLAQFRNGQYVEADQTLARAEQGGNRLAEISDTARLFRAMTLAACRRVEEGRRVFNEVEVQMPPLPQDEKRPLLSGTNAPHDIIITWLAYREAKSLLYPPPAGR